MKKIGFLLFIPLLLPFASCKKDESKVQGMVRYIDSTGAYFSADSAMISVHNKDTSAAAELTENTDAEGIYFLEGVPDGQWVVRAYLQVDSNTTYIGVSEKFECYGKDFVGAKIDMKEQ